MMSLRLSTPELNQKVFYFCRYCCCFARFIFGDLRWSTGETQDNVSDVQRGHYRFAQGIQTGEIFVNDVIGLM